MKFLIALFTATLLIQVSTHAASPKKGDTAPNISTKDIDGKAFDLSKEVKAGPVVLVFYRGGWCPYCNLQLKQLQNKLIPNIKGFKAQVVAISADQQEEASKTRKNQKLDMTLISDSSAQIVKAYDIVNQVPAKLVKKYKDEYKIDLEKASGKKHHIIPIPAVFIVNKDMKLEFSYINEDYKVRAQIKDIIKALKSL